MCRPAGLSPARWPCPMHQSKTVSILCRSRVAVSVLDVHIGSRTPNASDVVILSLSYRQAQAWRSSSGYIAIEQRVASCARSDASVQSPLRRPRQTWVSRLLSRARVVLLPASPAPTSARTPAAAFQASASGTAG